VPLRVYDWRFRDRSTEMLYVSEDPLRELVLEAGAAIGEDLAPNARTARLHEARLLREAAVFQAPFQGVQGRGEGGEDVDPDAVRALKPFIEQWEPGWVEAVKQEWPGRQGDVESVAFFAEVPLQATIAILENLYERGELDADE
jgi:hypothetical protein